MPVSSETLISRIRSAMANAGMNQQNLAQAVGLDPTALSKALSGVRNFKSLEVALIAEQLGVSVQSLLAENAEPTLSIAARAQPDTSPALALALERSSFLCELDRLLSDLGFDWTADLGVPSEMAAGQPYEQGEELSRRVRGQLGIGEQDLPYELAELSELLEQRLGVDIGFEPLPTGLDGLCAASGGFRLALVSSNIPATRQRFTLAHELGHLVAGDSQDLLIDENVFGRKTFDETRANAFAAAFLMPAAAIRAAVPHGISEEIVANLLGRFGVSLDALAFRLHNADVVPATGRDRIRSMSSSRIALRSGRASDLQARGDRRAPGNLLGRAIEAYVQGRISVRPLASLLSIDPEQLLAELRPPEKIRTGEAVDATEYNL